MTSEAFQNYLKGKKNWNRKKKKILKGKLLQNYFLRQKFHDFKRAGGPIFEIPQFVLWIKITLKI